MESLVREYCLSLSLNLTHVPTSYRQRSHIHTHTQSNKRPACGPTHTAVVPLDLVKTRRQVDPKLYTSNLNGWKTIYRAEGLRGCVLGWSPTFVGYAFQGAGKYGFYEVFKYAYGEKMFPNMNKTVVYLGASASAEFLADIALCPFEAVKVRMQTTMPPFARNMREGLGKIVRTEGFGGFVSPISRACLWRGLC